MDDRVPLSVLDLAPVPEGVSTGEALRNSIELAQHVERLGYTRHWVAEHHNFPGIASSSPAVLIAHLASATATIRVGSGGVMLPNHASLTVAEQFGMLEALHPDRIDLGLGRAPGTDPVTAAALRRVPAVGVEDGFPKQLGELLSYFDGSHAQITAVPAEGNRPALWMLGSSDYSATVAGHLGLPFSFAHHFAAANTAAALDAYREAFRPSPWLEQPYAMIGVPVVCADTDDHAEFLARPSALSFIRLRQGRPIRLVDPHDLVDREWSPAEEALLRAWRRPQVIGDPSTVRRGLDELVERFRVQELMITTMTHGHADRLRSYDLVATAWQTAEVVATAAERSESSGSVR